LVANLQHYSPLIDEQVQKMWNVPASWKLDAQLVFGTPTGDPSEKTFVPLRTATRFLESRRVMLNLMHIEIYIALNSVKDFLHYF
jgi:predicted oxidoreductase (fatty acid repression mutant protein)